MVEIMKLVYVDCFEYLGDLDFIKVLVKGLILCVYVDELVKKINLDCVMFFIEIKLGQLQLYESDQIIYYLVVDKDGNLVVIIYMLNLNFGSGIVVIGIGIILNNEMDDFVVKLGVFNVFGFIGGDVNVVGFYKCLLLLMLLIFVFKDGKFFLVIGSFGGSCIIIIILQIIFNVIDYDMNVVEVIIMLCIYYQWVLDQLCVEKGLFVDMFKILQDKGQKISVQFFMGCIQIIQICLDGFDGFLDLCNLDGCMLGF